MKFDKHNKEMKLPIINNSMNKSINVYSDMNEKKNLMNNLNVKNSNNSILKEKSFIRNVKNNSSLRSNRLDFNIDEDIIESIEKDKFVSFKDNCLKDLKRNINKVPNQFDRERNKITSSHSQINENYIIENNPIRERQILSNEGKTMSLNPIKNMVNSPNNHHNNLNNNVRNFNKSKVNPSLTDNVNNINCFILKNACHDKKSKPIKLFNINLNKVMDS